jgi:phosphomannomutase
MSKLARLRISQVGLRGVVGSGLTAQHAMDFASAFGTFLGERGTIVIGRDPRASGVMLREGVISALLACGHDVVDLGVVSTPVIQHAMFRTNACGGISIGASHNAVEWNALKFLGRGGSYLSSAEANELLDIYHLRKFAFVEWNALGKLTYDTTGIDCYLDELASAFDFDALKRFRIVVDCSNGTSSLILRRMQERYGFDFILINERIDGAQLAHEPTTSSRIVALQLAPLMKPTNADAGFLFDLDSDRVAMATENGEAVSEELMLPLLADYYLPRSQAKLIITNLSTTALVDEVAGRHGGTVIRVPVGRQLATDALATYRPEQVAIAGEGTGAVMMSQFRFVYDGIASMLAALTLMQERGGKLSEIVNSYPRYHILKGEVPLENQRIPSMLLEIRKQFSDGTHNTADGLRVDWPGKWFHVRVSQTEPVVRVIAEQRDTPPQPLFDSLLDLVRTYA